MTAWKWVLRVLFALIGIVAIIWVAGMLLPRDHMASRMGHYQVPPEKVWAALTDIDAMPSWRIGLKSVTRLPDKNGLPVHVERHIGGEDDVRNDTDGPAAKTGAGHGERSAVWRHVDI